jgi:hypothetical protein
MLGLVSGVPVHLAFSREMTCGPWDASGEEGLWERPRPRPNQVSRSELGGTRQTETRNPGVAQRLD